MIALHVQAAYNNLDGPHYKANQVRKLSQQRLEYELLSSMLEYYWQNGVTSYHTASVDGSA